MIHIETKPHMAEQKNDHSAKPFALAQDRVFVDGQHVGYVGHQHMAPIVLITQVSDAVKAALVGKLGDRKIAEPARLRRPRRRRVKHKSRIIMP